MQVRLGGQQSRLQERSTKVPDTRAWRIQLQGACSIAFEHYVLSGHDVGSFNVRSAFYSHQSIRPHCGRLQLCIQTPFWGQSLLQLRSILVSTSTAVKINPHTGSIFTFRHGQSFTIGIDSSN